MADWLGEGGVLQRGLDAFAGIDREKAFREGLLQRSVYDQNQAQTQAALAAADERQKAAQLAADIQSHRDAYGRSFNPLDLNSPENFTNIVLGNIASDVTAGTTARGNLQTQSIVENLRNPNLPAAQAEAEARAGAIPTWLSNTMNPNLTPVRDEKGQNILLPNREAVGYPAGFTPVDPAGRGSSGDNPLSPPVLNFIDGLSAQLAGGEYDPNSGKWRVPKGKEQEALLIGWKAGQYVLQGYDPYTAVQFAYQENQRGRPPADPLTKLQPNMIVPPSLPPTPGQVPLDFVGPQQTDEGQKLIEGAVYEDAKGNRFTVRNGMPVFLPKGP